MLVGQACRSCISRRPQGRGDVRRHACEQRREVEEVPAPSGSKWEPGLRGRCARQVGLGEADGIRGPAVPQL